MTVSEDVDDLSCCGHQPSLHYRDVTGTVRCRWEYHGRSTRGVIGLPYTKVCKCETAAPPDDLTHYMQACSRLTSELAAERKKVEEWQRTAHEVNVRNEARKVELEAKVEELNAECRDWTRRAADALSRLAEAERHAMDDAAIERAANRAAIACEMMIGRHTHNEHARRIAEAFRAERGRT